MLMLIYCESCLVDEQDVPSTCYRHSAWLCDACAADLDYCLAYERAIHAALDAMERAEHERNP